VPTLEKLDAKENTEWDQLMHQKLVLDRGAKWIDGFEKSLAGNEGTLYVVGLGHLIGKGNLLERLTEKGYKIGQVKIAKPEKDGEEPPQEKKKPALIPVSLHRAPSGC